MSKIINFLYSEFSQKEYLLKISSLLFFAFLLLPPSVFSVFRTDIDPSFQMAIHLAVKNNLVFGRDFIFTYGPLGILAARLPVHLSEIIVRIFDLYVIGNIIFIIYLSFKKSFSLISFAVVFFILFFFLNFYNPQIVWVLFFIFCFMIFLSLESKRPLAFLLNSSVLLNILFFLKLNLGIVAYLIFIFFVIYAIWQRHVHFKMIFVSFILSILFCILFSYLLEVDIIGYSRGALELINAYNDAMYLPVRNHLYLWLSLFIVCLFLIIILTSYMHIIRNEFSLFVILLTVVSVYLLFKQAFVRADVHVFIFFRFITLVFVLPWFFIPLLRKKFSMLIIASLFVCLIPLHEFIKDNAYRIVSTSYFSSITPETSYFACQDEVRMPEVILKDVVGKNADVIPWAVPMIYFNKLEYNPRPVIASYSAYTSYLDSMNHRKYLSAHAPDIILYKVSAIDNRYHLWDETRTKLAILQKYEAASKWDDILLLQNSERLLKIDTLEKRSMTFQVGEDIIIPLHDGICLSRIKVDYTIAGHIRRLFFQPPDLSVTITSETNREFTYKGVKTILGDGIIINKRISNINDITEFFRSNGESGEKFIKFRIHTNQPWGIHEKIVVDFFLLNFPSG